MKHYCRLKQAAFPAPLLVDKPTGVTSHDVVDWARRLTGLKKIGHTGTLDPLATGLLIILIGRSWTKRQNEFLKQAKVYQVTCQFGQVSDTYDIDGRVKTTDSTHKVSLNEIERAVQAKFLGLINQLVPPFSAVKQNGRKLYQLARAGRLDKSSLPSRQVTIKQFRLLDFDQKNQQAKFNISVSSGTYIRSLIHDLGQALKVGAMITSLRRTQIGRYKIENAFCCPLIN